MHDLPIMGGYYVRENRESTSGLQISLTLKKVRMININLNIHELAIGQPHSIKFLHLANL